MVADVSEAERAIARDGSVARVRLDYGGNVVSWQLGGVEVLAQPSDYPPSAARPELFGIPVLFPFPGRARRGAVEIGDLRLTGWPGDGRGNGLHGLLYVSPVDVIEHTADRLRLSLTSDGSDRRFPFLYEVELEIALGSSSTLSHELAVKNRDRRPLVFGAGIHPSFKVPFGPGGGRDEMVVTLPAASRWPLVDMLPGSPHDVRPVVPGDDDFRRGASLGTRSFDDLYGALTGDVAELRDPVSGRAVRMRAARASGFREWQIFSPRDSTLVAIEPYTCPTDAFWLARQGADVGLITLAPNEEWRARTTIEAIGFGSDR